MDGVDEDLRRRLTTAFRWVDPGPDAAHEVSDTSGWWRDPGLLRDLGPALAGLRRDPRPTVIVAPETSGFLLGPLVATALGAGFVEAYKDQRGHVADRMLRRTTTPDYRGRVMTLSVRGRLLTPADRALVVDDWVTTGAQLVTLRALILSAGADYLGAVTIVDDCTPGVAAAVGLRSLLTRQDLDAPG
jgi:adenine phosphoribosyltransferase